MSHSSEETQLMDGARALGVALEPRVVDQLMQLLDELARWNRAYNLTAITAREQMLTHHLLDSLAIHADLRGETIADVGSGGGFPGLPLAMLFPQRHFTLIDSNNKKVRFISHAVRTLQMANVVALHSRVEDVKPDKPFDTVVARAFAPLPELLERVATLCGPETHVLAMKGKRPDAEIAAMSKRWRLLDARPLVIPNLGEDRCVLTLQLSAL